MPEVMLDAIACEPQFVDHILPVWRKLPERGTFYVPARMLDRAGGFGTAIDEQHVRASMRDPGPQPQDGPLAFAVSIGDMKVARRMGYTRFIFMEHGAGQAYLGDGAGAFRHSSYAGGVGREDNELFLVPNEYSAAIWRRAYPAAAVEVVGCPKLDTLPLKDPSEPLTVAISFHWPSPVVAEAGTALGHYSRALKPLAQRFHTIGHAHPKADWPSRMQPYYRSAGIEFVADFEEVCRRADVYICDNSSTLFEFAATGRPVVVLNAPQWRRKVHHGLRFWEAATVGLQVDEPGALNATVARALEDRAEDVAARGLALSIVYAYASGGARRAADAISRHLEGRRAASRDTHGDQPAGVG